MSRVHAPFSDHRALSTTHTGTALGRLRTRLTAADNTTRMAAALRQSPRRDDAASARAVGTSGRAPSWLSTAAAHAGVQSCGGVA